MRTALVTLVLFCICSVATAQVATSQPAQILDRKRQMIQGLDTAIRNSRGQDTAQHLRRLKAKLMQTKVQDFTALVNKMDALNASRLSEATELFGTPKDAADLVLSRLSSIVNLESATFVDYSYSPILHTDRVERFDSVPDDAGQICVNYQFQYVTRLGLIRQSFGSVIVRREANYWRPVTVGLDELGVAVEPYGRVLTPELAPYQIMLESGLVVKQDLPPPPLSRD
jgi:hypothetical protein